MNLWMDGWVTGWGVLAAGLAGLAWWLVSMPSHPSGRFGGSAWAAAGQSGFTIAGEPPDPAWTRGTTSRARWLLALMVALAALGGFAGLLTGQRLVLVGVAMVALTAAVALIRRRRRDRLALETSARVQEVCALAAAELSAGLTTTRALSSCARSWPPMETVSRAAQMGASVPDALRVLARRPGAQDLVLMAAAWQVAHRTGAGLADALSSVADAIRARAASARLVRSELASARATARLMAVLPLLTLLMGSGMGGDPVGTLLDTQVGLACLAGGVVLMAVGLAWIEGIAGAIQRQTEIGRLGGSS